MNMTCYNPRRHRAWHLLWLVLVALPLVAEPLDGKQLMEERKASNAGWGSSEVDIEMTLVSQSGESTERRLVTRALELEGEGDKSLTIFREPRDVSGVALLNHSHISGADDQWLYLPSVRRVKRISSSNKSGAFMGSEFSFEDMASFEVEKYDYTGAEQRTEAGMDYFVVRSVPAYENSGYQRLETWLDPEHMQPVKVEFYRHGDTPYKTLSISEFRTYDNGIVRGHRYDMENHKTAKSTTLVFSDFDFDVDLTDADFRTNVLQRIR